jgi:hypothetical protein
MNAEDEKLRELEARVRRLLLESTENLSAETRSRLTRARFTALEAAGEAATSVRWRAWVPVGSVAGAAALAVLLWSQQQPAPPVVADTSAQPAVDDLDILVADESFDLLEDLEFYDSLEPAQGADGADIG